MNEYTSHHVTRWNGHDGICGILVMLIMIPEATFQRYSF